MRLKSTKFIGLILVALSFLTTGILLVRAANIDSATQASLASGTTSPYENLSPNRGDVTQTRLYSESALHFEPFLLLLMGTVLLSVVACINVVRSRRVSPHFHSVAQAAAVTEPASVPRPQEAKK